jgi:hypothetical protein
VKLTSHLQVVPRTRKRGLVHPFPIHFHGVVLNLLSIDTASIFLSLLLLKKIVGLERGPLSLVSTTEELLDRKVAAPV